MAFGRGSSKPSGAVSSADPQRVKDTRDAQSAFVQSAGPASSWTPEQRQEFNQVVSDRQAAELDLP